MPILAGLAGLASAFMYVIKFLKGILLKYATHAVILSIQFTITATTIAFVIAFYAFTITSFIAIYNSVFDFFDYLFQNTDSSLSCMYSLLDCTGVTPALENGVSLFFASIFGVMMFHLMRFTFGALNVIKNEIFKLGVLLGQAVN